AHRLIHVGDLAPGEHLIQPPHPSQPVRLTRPGQLPRQLGRQQPRRHTEQRIPGQGTRVGTPGPHRPPAHSSTTANTSDAVVTVPTTGTSSASTRTSYSPGGNTWTSACQSAPSRSAG